MKRRVALLSVALLAFTAFAFSADLSFKGYVEQYWNKPGYTIDSMAAAAGVDKKVILDYVTYAQRKNYEKVISAGEVITAAELLAVWDKEHPPVVCRQTPFGLYCVPPTEKLVGELTVSEFEALLAKHTGK